MTIALWGLGVSVLVFCVFAGLVCWSYQLTPVGDRLDRYSRWLWPVALLSGACIPAHCGVLIGLYMAR